MKVHAVWAHGVVLEMFVVHPGVPHDSALVLECLMRTMEDVSEIFQKHGKPLPREMLSWVPCLVPGMFLDLSAWTWPGDVGPIVLQTDTASLRN